MHLGITHRTFSYVFTNVVETVITKFLFGTYRYRTPGGALARSRYHDDFWVADLVPGMKDLKQEPQNIFGAVP